MMHEKKNKNRLIISLIFLFILIAIVIIIIILLLRTCNNKKQNNNPQDLDSYIEYYDDTEGKNIKFGFPYCEKNVDALCSITYDDILNSRDFEGYVSTFIYEFSVVKYNPSSNLNEVVDFQIVQNELRDIYFGSEWDEMTSAPDNFCNSLYAYNANIKGNVTFTLPKNILTVSKYFCFYTFTSSLITEINFQTPKRITKIDTEFYTGLFSECPELTDINDDFELPLDASYDSNTPFSACAFFCFDCQKLKKIPNKLNFKFDKIDKYDEYCFGSAFENCKELQTIPLNFEIPENKLSTRLTGGGDVSDYATYLFARCENLKSGNDEPGTIFTLPENSGWRYAYVFDNSPLQSNFSSQFPYPGEFVSVARNQ